MRGWGHYGCGRTARSVWAADGGEPVAYATGAFSDQTADTAGSFMVVWESDGAGVPLGSEFHVNTYTTSAQSKPAVATDAAGNFVVVRTSPRSSGSNSSIGPSKVSDPPSRQCAVRRLSPTPRATSPT